MDIADLRSLSQTLRVQIGTVVIGQAETVDLMLVALFCNGHMLLEGPPGTAKTLLAQCLAASLGLTFGRVQFTPDLLPGDILGTAQFNFQTSSFVVNRGPIFCELLLADEINRTPPKTQAALLEAMQERQVTLDGKTHPLSERFMVIATENPIEQQGTYPLPEAQLDRFLFKHTLAYPSAEEELAIVTTQGATVRMPDPFSGAITQVIDAATLAACVRLVESVTLTAPIAQYIVSIIRTTRTAPDIAIGASPRSGAMLAAASRAHAALDGRSYVIPDDVKALLLPALRHRIVLSATAEIDGRKVDDVLRTLIETTEVPR